MGLPKEPLFGPANAAEGLLATCKLRRLAGEDSLPELEWDTSQSDEKLMGHRVCGIIASPSVSEGVKPVT